MFFQIGGSVLSLWDRERLAEDSGVTLGSGYGGITLAHNVGSPEEVDEIAAHCRARRRDASREPPVRPSGAATRACSSTPTGIRGRSRTTRTGRSAPTGA